jgi:hypothetical protein
MAAVAKDVDTEIEALKQGSDGKRGKYRTPKLEAEVSEGVISRCLAGLKPRSADGKGLPRTAESNSVWAAEGHGGHESREAVCY